MTLRKEIIGRLLLAKSILSHGRVGPAENPDSIAVAKQVLNAHDAADLVFAAIADQQGRLPPRVKAPSMLQCLDLIETEAEKHSGYFSQLNDARNGLKHAGNFPNATQWARVAEESFLKLCSICSSALGVSLAELDESELLASGRAKNYLIAAKQAIINQDFRLALEELARALYFAVQESGDWWDIEVGVPKAEDALRLSALGVPANEFLRLQDFLPSLSSVGDDTTEVVWKQAEYGHPGNWRQDAVQFCVNACMRTLLCIQQAPPTPPSIPFSALYQFQVTAREDNVEVWEDLVVGQLVHIYGPNADVRPLRSPKRYLKKGDSIIVPPHVQHFITDDASPTGESIKRVRVSCDVFSSLYPGQGRAEFVSRSEVEITCVPSALGRKMFPSLASMAWIDEPPNSPS